MPHHQRVPSYLFCRDETDRRFVVHMYDPEFIVELNADGTIKDFTPLHGHHRKADEHDAKVALEWYQQHAAVMRGGKKP